MTPLDLRERPPRNCKEELDGLVFLPRTIDKIRATLPGGHLGAYRIKGFTVLQLETVGVSVEAFTAAVAEAPDAEAVAAWLRSNADPAKYEIFNAQARAFPLVGSGDREEAIRRYPWLAERPDISLQFDVLEEDDRRLFAHSRPAP